MSFQAPAFISFQGRCGNKDFNWKWLCHCITTGFFARGKNGRDDAEIGMGRLESKEEK